jgi:hypothetical protein
MGTYSLVGCKFWFSRQDFDIRKHNPTHFISKKYLFSLMLLYKEHIKVYPKKQITIIKTIINAITSCTTVFNPLFLLYLTDDYNIQYHTFVYYLNKFECSGLKYSKKYKLYFNDLVLHFTLEDCMRGIISLEGYGGTTVDNILYALIFKYSCDEIVQEIHNIMKNTHHYSYVISAFNKALRRYIKNEIEAQ